MWRRPAAPPHISIILEGAVRLEGLTPELRKAVTHQGLRLRRDLWSGSVIRFDPPPVEMADNPQLVRILETLARLGFAFSSDYKQICSPEATLRDLRARGLFQGSFLACGFDGSQWHVREVPVGE